jgi:DNA invertase Pin-like site-specific DNA recombinase
MSRFVAYYRVSTDKQGRSGLGLEAQREAVEGYAQSTGGTILAEYQEIESGKDNERAQLHKALHHAKVTGARLLIAKLDRLSRDAAFLLTLQNQGTPFTAVDMPNANEMTVGVMALVAQDERQRISDRTKAGLRAAKARGTRLGNPNGAKALGTDNTAGTLAASQKAQGFAADLSPIVAGIRAEGTTSLAGIARELNQRGIQTARGGRWHASNVKNLLARIDG